jgi:hypothetical protein
MNGVVEDLSLNVAAVRAVPHSEEQRTFLTIDILVEFTSRMNNE